MQYKRPNLSVELKLAVYKLQKDYTTSEKHIVQESAEVLEELLGAVENGL